MLSLSTLGWRTLWLLPLLILPQIFPQTLCASPKDQKPQTEIKGAMRGMVVAFSNLQINLLDQNTFVLPEKDKEILDQIKQVQEGFHSIWKFDEKWRSIPGIDSRLIVLKRSIDEAKAEFQSGEKRTALWRLRSISGNCVGCHIQTQGKSLLSHEGIAPPSDSPFVKAEFALIFKEFSRAANLYEQAIVESKDYRLRVDALWKWILVVAKYLQDPELGMVNLSKIRKAHRWKTYEKELIKNWEKSFADWKVRKKNQDTALTWAREFYDRRLNEENDFDDGITLVDLLFLAGALEDSLESKTLRKEERGETLLMLGNVYSKMSPGLANQFPDTYYELCIREVPETVISRSCYHAFQRLVDFGFGNYVSESRMPASVERELEALHDLAFGTKTKEGVVGQKAK